LASLPVVPNLVEAVSLAKDRIKGRLICQCPQPDYRPVVLFSALVLSDVFECARCGKPILEKYRRHLDQEAS